MSLSNPQVVPKGYTVEFWVDPNLRSGRVRLDNISLNHAHRFHAPGIYKMSAWLSPVGDRRNRAALRIASGDHRVLESKSDQVFQLRLDVDDVEAAIEALKR